VKPEKPLPSSQGFVTIRPMSASSSGPLVTASGLTKKFEDFTAVDNIDFSIEKGEVFGFLGPNGAGKSSTMRMIGAVSPITSGSLSVFGLNPESDGSQIRGRIGVVPQEDMLDDELRLRDNLYIYGRYFDMSRAELREKIPELLEFAQLSDKADSKVQALSGGMKRRLTIARALINSPELVLLDEPTTGLDPQARHVLWEKLYQLKAEGVTLIITTHYMDEAEQLCDRLVVMDNGKIVAEGSPRSLIAEHATKEVLEVRFKEGDREAAAPLLERIAHRFEDLADRTLLYVDSGDAAAAALSGAGYSPISALPRRASLEDVFLRLTGRTLVD
jgi:lipooligosaccharide transport system ATP-binding protein